MSIYLADYRDLYFSEAHEQLALVAKSLQRLERDPGDRAALEAAFRAAHTLKGMSATMGYDAVLVSAHGLEDLFQAAREYPQTIRPAVHLLSRALDELDATLAATEAGEMPASARLERRGASELAQTAPAADTPPTSEAPAFARVSVEYLNQLANLTTELVARGNYLKQAIATRAAIELAPQLQAQWRTLQELQGVAWALRMAPVGDVFNRYPPMLEQIAAEQGKYLRVAMEGEEIEVDRALLEELNEPLLHLVRNAAAHGIEPPAERLQMGKDPRGTIHLGARRTGAGVTFLVQDDGRGLDPERILQTAYEQQLISAEQRRNLSETEAFNLITLPGFTLAPAVTAVAGRGFGMNAVKAKVEVLHGTLCIFSELGRGATFSFYIPHPPREREVELVRVGENVYGVPAANIARLLTLSADQVAHVQRGESDQLKAGTRILDARALVSAADADTKPPAADREYKLIVFDSQSDVALRVDEFLGKVLLSEPATGHAPAVPLLDPYSEGR